MDGWVKPSIGAEYAGTSLKTFRGWLKDGLKHSRLKSGHFLIKIQNIDEYLSRFEISESRLDRELNRLLEDF
jgi:hypothetical protein